MRSTGSTSPRLDDDDLSYTREVLRERMSATIARRSSLRSLAMRPLASSDIEPLGLSPRAGSRSQRGDSERLVTGASPRATPGTAAPGCRA